MKRLAGAIALLSVAAPAAAAPITITKAAAPVSDGINLLAPKILPGGTVEYTLTATNPLLNTDRIANVTVCDVLPDSMTLLTADLGGTGAGPVAFSQGLLVGSGLAYAYVSLAAPGDGLAFYDAGGALIATPTVGSDARVRKLCVTLTGTRMTAGGSFNLRYRAVVK